MIRLTIEIEKGFAYISDDCGGTGLKIYGNSQEQLSRNIAEYVRDYVCNE